MQQCWIRAWGFRLLLAKWTGAKSVICSAHIRDYIVIRAFWLHHVSLLKPCQNVEHDRKHKFSIILFNVIGQTHDAQFSQTDLNTRMGFTWVSSGFSGFFLLSKNKHSSRMSTGVNVCVCTHTDPCGVPAFNSGWIPQLFIWFYCDRLLVSLWP